MEVKDQATAVEAALNLNKGNEPVVKPGEPVPPKVKSTTQKLFPENITDDGAIINRPVRVLEPTAPASPGTATPAPAAAAPAPATPAPTPGTILDLSKLDPNTMVRMKVDGVEMDVPAATAVKNIQLERHLTLKSQELATERAKLEAERAALRQQTPATPPAAAPNAPKPVVPAAPSPEAGRIAQLEADIAALKAANAPQMFERGLQRLADRAKTEFGVDDFSSYVPRIKEFVDGELAKPEVAANPQLVAALDQQNFWYAKFQEFKLKDMIAGKSPATPAPTAPAAPIVTPIATPPGTTMVFDRNGNPIPIPVLEGSNGVPSRVSPNAEWQARYQAALATAKKTGLNEDWQAVFRIKREPENQ